MGFKSNKDFSNTLKSFVASLTSETLLGPTKRDILTLIDKTINLSLQSKLGSWVGQLSYILFYI